MMESGGASPDVPLSDIDHRTRQENRHNIRPGGVDKPRSKLRDRLRHKCLQQSCANSGASVGFAGQQLEGGQSEELSFGSERELFGLYPGRDSNSQRARSVSPGLGPEACSKRPPPNSDLHAAAHANARYCSKSDPPVAGKVDRFVGNFSDRDAMTFPSELEHGPGSNNKDSPVPTNANNLSAWNQISENPGRRKDERQLWSKDQDNALRQVMRELDVDSLFTAEQYHPVGEVDWDSVVFELNKSLTSEGLSAFSKKQVKDRWEQHLRPGLLQHKSLTKLIRQRIIALLEDAIPRETYINRGKPCVRWMNIASHVWELGLRCSASTIKNVWNSHQQKGKTENPGREGKRHDDAGLEYRVPASYTVRHIQQSDSPTPDIHAHQLPSGMSHPMSRHAPQAADWHAYWQLAAMNSRPSGLHPSMLNQRRPASPTSPPSSVSEQRSRELAHLVSSAVSERDDPSPGRNPADYPRHGKYSPGSRMAPRVSPNHSMHEAAMLAGLNNPAASAYPSLYGMYSAAGSAYNPTPVSPEAMYRMYVASAAAGAWRGYFPPSGHSHPSSSGHRKNRGFPLHTNHPGLHHPSTFSGCSSPGAFSLTSSTSEWARSYPGGFMPADDTYAWDNARDRQAARPDMEFARNRSRRDDTAADEPRDHCGKRARHM